MNQFSPQQNVLLNRLCAQYCILSIEAPHGITLKAMIEKIHDCGKSFMETALLLKARYRQ